MSPLTRNGFVEKYKSKTFIETIAEYDYDSTQSTNNTDEDGSTLGSLAKKKYKRMIIFTLID